MVAVMNTSNEPLLTVEQLEEFQARAATYDRENTFFTEDWEVLKDSGYLLMPVPEELGGLG
ncbi:MAG: acyl-CoA dehydrogenase family protein, partial [Gammaproteobacteria bacterium]|nr:acyl-CoA dehydrogenase family protein [Gammaproteobacteria bacterium]